MIKMFKDKDVICFLGDSITAKGLWMAEVYQELRKKYQIKCYNIGVSGGRMYMAEKYLYSRCLAFNPDYVTVMFGINDIEHTWYKKDFPKLTDDELKSKAVEIYKESYERVINKIIVFGAQPIVCISVPYDDVNDTPTENLYNQTPLDELVEFQREMAEKYNCPVVDFKAVMRPMLKERKVISDDRVHPTEEGYHVMAQVFLHDTGEQENLDFDTPFEFEEWNKLRYDKEQQLRGFNFAEYCYMIDDNWAVGKSAEEKKQAALDEYEKCGDKTTFVAEAFRDYPKMLDMKEQIMEDVIRLTI